jgi:hypothetical protein
MNDMDMPGMQGMQMGCSRMADAHPMAGATMASMGGAQGTMPVMPTSGGMGMTPFRSQAHRRHT